jgi:arsenite methyltransferase
MNTIERNKIDYGIDAPGIRNGMFVIAVFGGIILGVTNFAEINWLKNTPIISVLFKLFGITIGLYGSFMGSYMTYCSRIGKLKTRDILLDKVGKYIKWDEINMSLDVGCGKGLLLIGAAKRLSNGRSLGIDIWSANDQSNNSQSATIENAALAGVSDKIQIQTADARNLPYENDTIDLVMSHWVVHNIETETEQIKCLNEMYRVLKPGGAIILADIQNVSKYKQHIQKLGATKIEFDDGGFEAKIMSVLSGGTYVPQSLICVKPK